MTIKNGILVDISGAFALDTASSEYQGLCPTNIIGADPYRCIIRFGNR